MAAAGIGFAAAVALGAVISPPDAVAATPIGKRLGLPPRLVTILEGEGLVNDATALVLLRTAVAAIAGTVSFWGALGDFTRAVLIGIIVGAVTGVVSVSARSRIEGQPVLRRPGRATGTDRRTPNARRPMNYARRPTTTERRSP